MAVYRPTYKDPATGKKITSDVFWCDFTYQGKRIREGTGQTLKTLAKDYEKRRRRELEEAVAGTKPASSAERIMDLKDAIDQWLTIRTAGKREKTKAYIRDRCVHLKRLLGDRLVCDLVERDVAEYVHIREAEGAVSTSINREVYFLARVLRTDRKAAWPNLGASTKNRERAGRAMTEDEVRRLLAAARENKSRYALPFISLALFTGFRSGEVRVLRWRQVDFMGGHVRSELSKTTAGEYREVPLLPQLRTILLEHRAWLAEKLDSVPEPDHFVFPLSSRGCPRDPERPVTNIASSWYAIREAAGVRARLHDCRHTYASRLLEAGASEAVVREIMGHVDPAVLRRYTHLRREARDAAVLAAFGGGESTGKCHVKDSPKVSPASTKKPRGVSVAKSLIM